TEFFEKAIRPLLAEKCHECHGGGPKVRGGLRLTGRELVLKGGESGPAAVPGEPDQSLLVDAIEQRGELKMPPPGNLSQVEIGRLRQWIRLGLPWTDAPVESTAGVVRAPSSAPASHDWWALQPVKVVNPPTVKDTAWPRSEIDRFILAGLEA